MSIKVLPVDPFDLVIFGGTGDLAMRKLIPALYRRFASGVVPETSRILGMARTDTDTTQYRKDAQTALKEFIGEAELQASVVDQFIEMLFYSKNDVMDDNGWKEIKAFLNEKPDHIGVFYLSVGPSLFGIISEKLAQHGLADNGERLVVEKPLGHDLESARTLNETITQFFDECCVYRIDHYLGKESVQNLMALRFANALFEPMWNANYIDHVQITAAETVSVGSRGAYYDNAGAIRDMVQNHLLQLLCLIAMEAPYKFEADAVRNEKLKVLKSLQPLIEQAALDNTVRGQYAASDNEPSYLTEAGNDDSYTECYVALKASINNSRWNNVPFYLRTGKKLKARSTEISIHFKEQNHSIFGDLSTPLQPNALMVRLQPDESIQLNIMTKVPGPGGMRVQMTPLDMSFSEGKGESWRMPDAYERLLMDVVRGDQTLFMRGDEVEAAWKWIDPIIDAWKQSGIKPESYEQGGEGPIAAMELIAKDKRRWIKIS